MPLARKSGIFGLHSIPANTTPVPLKTAKKAVFACKEFFRRTCRRKNKNGAENGAKLLILVFQQTGQHLGFTGVLPFAFGVNKMKQTMIETGTITYAIKGRDLLRKAGYQAKIARNFGGAGCGYGIAVTGDTEAALALLKKAGIKTFGIKET